MNLRINWLAVLVAVTGMCAGGLAQIPFEPAQSPTVQAAPAPQHTPQFQADVDWLTSYMLVNEGYRFDHLPALEQSFEKMSPTQLHTLRKFYEQKYALQMQHAATVIQAQQKQIQSQQSQATGAAAAQRRQQQEQAFFLTPEQDAWAGAITNVRLQNMQNIAEANENGYLFNTRTIPGFRTDPFGPTPMRPVGFGNWGERRDDLSPNAGAN